MKKTATKRVAEKTETPRDEQGYEMVPCCCVSGDVNGWTRLQFAGQCGDCGRYTCEWCSAHVDHSSTPCVACAAKRSHS